MAILGVPILDILKVRGSENRPTFLNVAGYFWGKQSQVQVKEREGWSHIMNLFQIFTEPMNMHLASGEKGLSFPRSLWRMADGGPFPGLYREIRSKLSWCPLSLPGRRIFSLYFFHVDTARVVQYFCIHVCNIHALLSSCITGLPWKGNFKNNFPVLSPALCLMSDCPFTRCNHLSKKKKYHNLCRLMKIAG